VSALRNGQGNLAPLEKSNISDGCNIEGSPANCREALFFKAKQPFAIGESQFGIANFRRQVSSPTQAAANLAQGAGNGVDGVACKFK
jgi:hypothetical protein